MVAKAEPSAVSAVIQPEAVDVTCSKTIAQSRHPNILYWFWTNEMLKDRAYLQDIRDISEKSRFNFLMMSDRTAGLGNTFHDTGKMHGIFSDVVAQAHSLGLKVGLQLWAEGFPKLTPENAVACVTEGEVTLDAQGQADYSVTGTQWVSPGGGGATAGNHYPIASEPLRAFAFRKVADGTYEPGTLVELPATALKVEKSAPASVTLKIEASPELAGYTVYVLVAHYIQFPDLFSEVMTDHLTGTLRQYKDIPFDGTALDEFGWMMLKNNLPDESPFRERFYGKAFAREFNRQKGRPLESELFAMRYSPANDPNPRIRAINAYFDVMRQGPLRVEKAFRSESKKLFGEGSFSGVHNTYQNYLENPEIWRTGINWWRIEREYGQSDEDINFPVRMGLLINSPQPVMYDMYYSKELSSYPKKMMVDARYNVRTHFHAWNDNHWGRDCADPELLATINPLQDKIALLDRFDPAPPKMRLLVVFGMPAQLNWFPNAQARNRWDINSLGVEQKAVAIWKAGYPCALVSSDLIDDGRISISPSGKPVLNGQTFDALVYLYPQYATSKTLDFLEKYAGSGGRFMLEGDATYDFEGNDIAQRFAAIAAKATERQFNTAKLPSLGVTLPENAEAGELADGSLIFSDLESVQTGKPKAFKARLSGHEFSGDFIGVLAMKVDASGCLEKFAAGGFSKLLRDGIPILTLSAPADIVLRKEGGGKYHAAIKGTRDVRVVDSQP